jgi:hypothetical protein
MKPAAFALTCNNCQSVDTRIVPTTGEYWDDGYTLVCNNCDAKTDDIENELGIEHRFG